jgi:ribosomal protein L7/L12
MMIMAYIAGALLLLLLAAWLGSKMWGPTPTLRAEEVPADEHGVRKLIAAGEMIQAIKLVRSLTSLGLKESKDLVEAMQRGERTALPVRGDAEAPATGVSPELEAEVQRLLADGERIQAIKLWRERTGWGLAESKEAVEERETGPR